MIGLPILLLLLVFVAQYVTIERWLIDPPKSFNSIRETLSSYGNLTDIERGLIQNQTITLTLAQKAVHIALPTINDVLTHGVLPIIIIAAVYFIFQYGSRGGKKDNGQSISQPTAAVSSPKPTDSHHPSSRIGYFKDFNQTILTVGGLVITIVSGFLIAAGPKHFITIYGFIVLAASMLFAFIAHSALTSGIKKEQDSEMTIMNEAMKGFYDSTHLAFWYLMLGLLVIVGGLI